MGLGATENLPPASIDHSLVEIALTRVSGDEFEKFINVFLPAIIGPEYVPLGGVHDGGADAFLDVSPDCKTQPTTYYQASIQENHKSKIRDTIKRLQEVGRTPKTLVYVTAQTIKMIDKDQVMLTQETDVHIMIRDAKWISAHVNDSNITISAYKNFLQPKLDYLSKVGGTTFIEKPKHLTSRSVCVFLGQEVERRTSKSKLIDSVSDSLILWALEGTDPDEGILATREDLVSKIEDTLPTTKQFIRTVLDERLKTLSSKGNATGREIRWYKKTDEFCLPYETREIIRSENVNDEHLKAQVLQEFESRAQELTEEVSPRDAAEITLRAIELTFEARGLEVATFLENAVGEYEELLIPDQVDAVLQEAKLAGQEALITKETVLQMIRKAFYESSECERRYFSKLSRTFSLLFSLQVDPRVVEYFQSMSSALVLFIGTDILVRALSERYLQEEDKMTCNMLKMLQDAGSQLVLTQQVVEEVHSHLENTDWEFRDDFMRTEPYVTIDVARHSRRILIRAYFYAKEHTIPNVGKPRGWESFISQVCDFNALHNKKDGYRQIKKYFIEKFNMKFMSTADLEAMSPANGFQALVEKLLNVRTLKIRVLAENDARMVFGIYGHREKLREDHKANPLGYRTWWLTHETLVRKATTDIVEEKGCQYIMRPEFLLNFIALSPSMEEVRHTYESVFPSLLGIKLSNRMREDVFHNLMQEAKETMEKDDARVRVLMSEHADKLKGDSFKEYETQLLHQYDL